MSLWLLLVLQAVVANDPFFSNDIKGLIRLGGLVISILGPVFFVLFRLVFNTTNDKVKNLEESLNGYGKRLATQEAAQNSCSTEIATFRTDKARTDAEIRNMAISQAELKVKVEEMSRQQSELQRDVMSAITATGTQLTAAMTELKIEVARLTERNKFGDALSEIADIMRDSRREIARNAAPPRREG
jgi:chromosome segregation ATPase